MAIAVCSVLSCLFIYNRMWENTVVKITFKENWYLRFFFFAGHFKYSIATAMQWYLILRTRSHLCEDMSVIILCTFKGQFPLFF